MATKWLLELSAAAEKDIEQLDRPTRRRIFEKLEWLEEHFDFVVPLVLGGEFSDYYKLRVGDLRVIYRVNWRAWTITVHYIDRRDKIYKRK